MLAFSSSYPITINWCRTVQCTTDASWATLESPIPLGPLDQLMGPATTVSSIFIYEQNMASPNAPLIPLERLERSISLLLNHYPHLTGRLRLQSDGTSEITRLGTGVQLFSAECSSRLCEFKDEGHGRVISLPGAGVSLLPPFEGTVESVCCESMLNIQHTRFACGGVALGILALHILCDGDGFLQIVRDLAELYRGMKDGSGSPTLSQPPHLQAFLSDFPSKILTPKEKTAILASQPHFFRLESDEETYLNTTAVPSGVLPSPNEGRIVRFSSRELSALKSAATDPVHPERWVSTFEALCAHLYRHVHRARLYLRKDDEGLAKFGELSPTDFLTTVNLRSRLGLPPRHFQNGFMALHTHIPPDVLGDGPLYEVANILHELTRNPPGFETRSGIEETCKWMALQPDKRRIRWKFRDGSGCFVVTQWSKFDMYEGTVFDCKPTLASPTFGPYTPSYLPDGMATLLPTGDRDADADRGAIDVGLTLSKSVWDILDQDKEFRMFRDA